ncbi:hypothetical protein [Faecalibacillus intestinalis]|uniref:hypothetical protein n=1 Tax=Faecalibacillus intestinalis TaxID=1982626 RepID=UPI003FF089ED
MDEIDSSFILTKAENENYFSPIPVFDFDEKFDITGEDLHYSFSNRCYRRLS